MNRKIVSAILSTIFILGIGISTSCADDSEPFMLDGPGMVKEFNQSEQFSLEILDLVNRERVSRGLAPLDISYELNDAANIRAEEIVENFSHTRPD